MTSQQLKSEIQKALDNVPESTLQILFDYLKEMQKQSKGQVEMSNYLAKILREDQELLTRLAK